MEYLQHQINELSEQVRDIRKKLEVLPNELVEASMHHPADAQNNYVGNQNKLPEHKDILVDREHETWSSHLNAESGLSCEWQIRRLTAQLTTAYNRIAALEEELLSRRISPRQQRQF
ncbi:hypothetical protein Pse7367_3123 [Thalassoporum mexicanum PCC 7367]|uniref:hypothetical protein n=1 Tax=Thalassoporum mexicanum TaxID=3457544 RepID=UPI00029FB3D3|nr:hypothetical protein [Pseudanabaena sp. PCC 7367]AFY71371.1 hypothetical protein Pse7367_3123 [Pseudanabaena sp. PCC 7367]